MTKPDESLTLILSWSDDQWPQEFVDRARTFPRHAVKAVVAHLKGGEVHGPLDEPARCWICNVELGTNLLTDGERAWPQNAHHYITAHKVWTDELTALAEQLVLGESAAPSASTPSDSPEPAAPANPWAFDDAQLEAMASQTTANPRHEPVPQEQAAPQPQRSTPPRSRAARAGRRARRSAAAVRQSQPNVRGRRRRRPGEAPTPRRDPGTALARVTRPGAPPQHLPTSPADMAAAIAHAYPQAGHDLARKIVDVAHRVGAHPFDLANLIHFESSKTFRSDRRDTGAVGLLQFYPLLAQQSLGLTVDQLAAMSPVRQMESVAKHLDNMRGGQLLGTPTRLAMAVFFPEAINWPPGQSFPAVVTQNNPGIYTPADYAALVSTTSALPSSTEMPPYAPMVQAAQQATQQPPPQQDDGLWGTLSRWWGNLMGTDSQGAAASPQSAPVNGAASPPVSTTSAVWESDPSISVRLVTPQGQPFPPGEVQPGQYQVEAWADQAWTPIAPVQLAPGRSYRLYLQHGRLKWAEL